MSSGEMSDEQAVRILGEPLTRRRLLGGALQAGGMLGLLAAGGALAGCGGGGGGEVAPTETAETTAETAATTAAATTAAEEAAKRGGTLIVSYLDPNEGFDPAKWWRPWDWVLVYAVSDSPLSIDPYTAELGPGLASLPEVNPEGTAYTFKLRSGVKFHNGREMTAEDVKFTIERLLKPATESEGASLYTGLTIPGLPDLLNEKTDTLEGIRVDDKYTLTIQLENPDSVFPFLMALPFVGVVPSEVVEEIGDKEFNFTPVGTGPFSVKTSTPDQVILERNPDYWDPRFPVVDRVEYNFNVDPELAILRVERGEQDLVYGPIPEGAFQRLTSDPKLKQQIYSADWNSTSYVTLGLRNPDLAKLEVRKAIQMAINKDRLVRVLQGRGHPATGGLFSPLSPYYQEGLSYAYDPEAAKQTLSQSGYSGAPIPVVGDPFGEGKKLIQVVAQDLEAIGMKVDLRLYQNNYEPEKIPERVQLGAWELPYPHGSYVMDGGFTSAALKAGCCNYSEWTDPRFDKLAEEAHRTLDETKIVELYKEMDRIAIREQALWVPTYYPTWYTFVSARLRNYKTPVSPLPQILQLARYGVA